MMNFHSGYSNQLPNTLKSDLFKYRHGIFVEKLGWNLATDYCYETDQFDHKDTLYVVAKDNLDNITGCARLLPTTKPYLLQEVFPDLLNGLTPPVSSEIWEISRFTNQSISENKSGHKIGNHGQISELTFIELLLEVIDVAKDQGAKKLISVSPVGIERLLRRAGISSHRAGPVKVINGHAILACWIDIN